MKKELVPDEQGIALAILFVLGNASIYGLGARAGKDLWLAFLLAMALASPFILMYARVRSMIYDKSLSEGLEHLYGKWASRFFGLGYAAYFWRLACYVSGGLASFSQSISLNNTPQSVIVLLPLIFAIWAAKLGVETLARFASIFVRGVLFFLVVMFVLLLTTLDFTEFRPVLYDGFKPVFIGALELIDFPLTETVVLFGLFDVFASRKSPYKIYLPGALIAAFFLLSMSCASLATIGAQKYMNNYYPIFVATSRINLGGAITRLEAVVALIFILGAIFKVSVLILASAKALAIGLRIKNYRHLVTPLALAVIAGSQWFVKSVMGIQLTATKTIDSVDFTFQVLLPFVVWVIAEIKMFRLRKKGKFQ